MRKAIVAVFVMMGLMAVSMPAMAQFPIAGQRDPLGLVTSGLVIPYVGLGANQSWLEVSAPVSDVELHMFFYDATCVRQGPSVNLALTTNDLELMRLDNLGGNIPSTGLLTAASTNGGGFTLEPIPFPGAVHARVYWADLTASRIRVFEPIALSTLDNDIATGGGAPPSSGVWNPLRTAATFFAPLESTFHTTLYFVCPNANIAGLGGLGSGNSNTDSSTTRAFGTNQFPALVPNASTGVTPLRVRVYDDEENFLRDEFTTCNCLTVSPVTTISSVYASAAEAPFGTYSEVEGGVTNATQAVCSTSQVAPLATPGVKNAGNPCPLAGDSFCAFTLAGLPTCQFIQTTPATAGGGPFAFTGYKAIDVGSFDAWGRLSNGNICDIQGEAGAFDCSNSTFIRNPYRR